MPRIGRAVRAIFSGHVDHVAFLAHLMGVRAGGDPPAWPGSARRRSTGDVRCCRSISRAAGVQGADCLSPGRLALGRPHVVAFNGRARHPGRSYSLVADSYQTPGARPGSFGPRKYPRGALPLSVSKGELAPLDDDAEHELSERILGGHPGRRVVRGRTTNVDGNPLFLEERFFPWLKPAISSRTGIHGRSAVPPLVTCRRSWSALSAPELTGYPRGHDKCLHPLRYLAPSSRSQYSRLCATQSRG